MHSSQPAGGSDCRVFFPTTGATPVGGSDRQRLGCLDLLTVSAPALQQVIFVPTPVAGPIPSVPAA